MLITRKKGEKVHMYAFTGMYLGEFEITAADKKTISIVQKNGRTTTFDRETAKTPRCASRVTEEKEPDKKKATKKAAPASKAAKAPAKKASKKATVKPEAEEVEDVKDDDEYEDA